MRSHSMPHGKGMKFLSLFVALAMFSSVLFTSTVPTFAYEPEVLNPKIQEAEGALDPDLANPKTQELDQLPADDAVTDLPAA